MGIRGEQTPTKKAQILKLWREGKHDIWQISRNIESRPSYVASVLQNAKLITGYHDLYTSISENPQNIYSEIFRGRLGYKDLATASRSLELIENAYDQMSEMQDRAGQHHCMATALTLFNRARSIGKREEAEVFRTWLIERLSEADLEIPPPH